MECQTGNQNTEKRYCCWFSVMRWQFRPIGYGFSSRSVYTETKFISLCVLHCIYRGHLENDPLLGFHKLRSEYNTREFFRFYRYSRINTNIFARSIFFSIDIVIFFFTPLRLVIVCKLSTSAELFEK